MVHSQDFGEELFPDARWDRTEVSAIVRSLLDHFQARDERLQLREALLFRRKTHPNETGQYVPPPFDASRTIIKHASGILVDRAEHLASTAAENPPNVKVNVVTSSSGNVSDKALTAAGNQQAALDAIEFELDLHADQPPQEIISFYAATLGVGWYHEYENAVAWKTPARRYYDNLTEDEVKSMKASGELVTTLPDEQGRDLAESPSLWEARKTEAMKEAVSSGESLTIQEVLHPGTVYYRKDTRGYSMIAVIEEVPMWDAVQDVGDRFDGLGIVEDQHGNIVVGADLGGPAFGMETSGKTWIRIRLWTRDEVYYYVSRHQGGRPSGTGQIVYHTTHDYGEVPFWPVAAYVSGSSQPEEEFMPLLEGAYAMVPGYNQVLTLLSNAAIYNTTPRYILIKKDGSPVLDSDSGQMLVFETDNVAGLSPDLMGVVEAGNAEFKQLSIDNVRDIVTLLEVYSRELADTLPSDAATGSSSQHEPAWGTRLKQAAQNIKNRPLVKKHARAKTKQNRWRSRIFKHRGRPIIVYGRPQRRGTIANARREITLKPEDISLNISVHQDDNDAQERIVRTQVFSELLDSGKIGPITFYDEGMGKDDPVGAYREAKAGQLAEALYQTVTVPRVMARIQGRLADRTPNEIQSEAEAGARPDVKDTNVAEPAGLRQPSVNAPATQNPLPPLDGAGAPPVAGNLPL